MVEAAISQVDSRFNPGLPNPDGREVLDWSVDPTSRFIRAAKAASNASNANVCWILEIGGTRICPEGTIEDKSPGNMSFRDREAKFGASNLSFERSEQALKDYLGHQAYYDSKIAKTRSDALKRPLESDEVSMVNSFLREKSNEVKVNVVSYEEALLRIRELLGPMDNKNIRSWVYAKLGPYKDDYEKGISPVVGFRVRQSSEDGEKYTDKEVRLDYCPNKECHFNFTAWPPKRGIRGSGTTNNGDEGTLQVAFLFPGTEDQYRRLVEDFDLSATKHESDPDAYPNPVFE